MDEKLFLEEWKIDFCFNSSDESGNNIKCVAISNNLGGKVLSLYENDFILLKTIFWCNEWMLKDKQIIVVIKDSDIRAIGYQGLYIPLYCTNSTSKIMSENEVCELLDSFTVVRINKNGNTIISYEVPCKSSNSKRSL